MSIKQFEHLLGPGGCWNRDGRLLGVSGLMGWPRKTVAMGTMCWTGSFAILGTGVLVLSISMEIVLGLEIISTVSLISITVVTSLGFFLEPGWTGGVMLIA